MDTTMSDNFIGLARALKDAEMYSKAFEVFEVTLTKNPELAVPHRLEFRYVLDKLNNEILERFGANGAEDILLNLEKASKIYPDCFDLCNDIGKYLLILGYYKDAAARFEKFLRVCSYRVSVEKNLNSAKNMLVERWHYRMLNDNIRNEAYRQAIHKLVRPQEDIVIDVGTGTGLLSIYAHEAGARNIIACDGSETMTELANTILYHNKLIKDIKIVNKMSTSMNSNDLKGKASFLLTEMFDAGLFGEHVLQMLQHAWPILLSEKARVIPGRAEFFVAGAQCDHLNARYQLGTEAKTLLNLKKIIHVLTDETYDCEDVHLQKDIKYLSNPESVLEVNFNDIENIEKHLTRTEPYEVELKVTESGICNVVIGWFNLYLTDTIMITTDPRAEFRANAWQQAVFFDEPPPPVKSGDSIKLEFLMNGGCLKMKPRSNTKITRVSSEVVRFLNDEDYIKAIINCIPMATVFLGQIVDMSQTSVADLSPFPVFGLLLMKRGASTLLCSANNEHDKKFFIDVFKKNCIPLAKVTILVGRKWTVDHLNEEKYHAIFAHFLELGGDIDTRLTHICGIMKNDHLHADGLFIPANLWIVGQLVSSHWLDINNTLFDENVSNIRMAEFVNKYSVNINYYKDFSALKYVPLSEPVNIWAWATYGPRNRATINSPPFPVTKDGTTNAILCSYNIELMRDMKWISTRRANSFVDGMVCMTESSVTLDMGASVRIRLHRDIDGSIKLALLMNEE